MYTVEKMNDVFCVMKGDRILGLYNFECEAWELIRDLKRIDKYKKWGIPQERVEAQAVSEEHEEKLERDFLDLFMRLVVYGFGLFGFIVALYESIAWVTS